MALASEREAPSESARGDIGPDDFPDIRLFWRWAARSTRPFVGWILIGLGAIAILLGYLGVSREALVAKQLPFLISGGITGMVLVAVGAFFLGTEDVRKQLARLDDVERKIDDLHAVLLSRRDAPKPNGRKPRATKGDRVALRSGSSYHTPDCQMVEGKKDVIAVDARTIARRRLDPCQLCDPEPVKA